LAGGLEVEVIRADVDSAFIGGGAVTVTCSSMSELAECVTKATQSSAWGETTVYQDLFSLAGGFRRRSDGDSA
jgi:hypothetical protein